MDERTPGTAGGWRLLRGTVVGTAATALPVAGHLLAGGRAPGWPTVVFLVVLLGSVSTWLSGARWTFPRLLALLVVAQAAVHATFVATLPPVVPGGHEQHAAEHAVSTVPMVSMVSATPAMVAAHVAAAALTALLLRRGDAWLGDVLDALALRAVRLLDAWTGAYGVPPQPAPIRVLDIPRQRRAADAWWQRGPPQ
jgi:hypothetical protein